MTTMQREPAPADRPLSLQGYGREARRGPAPVALLLSLLVLAGVGGGVFWLYRGGVRGPDGPPEPLGAPVRDVRVAAPPQAPAVDPAAGLSIYKDDANAAPAAPTFTPPPEQPAPRPGIPVAAAMASPPAVTAGKEVLYAPTPAASPIAQAQPVTEPAKPAAAKAAKDASIDSLLASAATNPKPKPKLAPAETAKPAAAGGFQVQIGAFSSPALAEKSWQAAAGLAPGEMAGKGKRVAQVSKDGATLYRTAVTGFDTRRSALALCAKLTAAGKTCFVR
jgi:hypothetical protein